MAQLKDLIVAGSARLLGKTYFEDTVTINDTLEVDAIKADSIITPSLNSDGTNLVVGGNISLTAGGKYIEVGNGTAATNAANTGVLRVKGGLSASHHSYFDNTVTIKGGLTAQSTLAVTGAITGSSTLAVTGAITGSSTLTVSSTGQVGNTFTIKNASGNDAALIFDRASNANWKILSSSGTLYFQSDYTTSKGNYYNILRLDYSTKQTTVYGNVLPNANATQYLGGSSNKWKALYVGDASDATSTSTGVIQATGGIAATKAGYFGGDVTADQFHITNDSGVGHITFARASYNYIHAKTTGGVIAFVVNGQTVGSATSEMVIQDGVINPGTTAVTDLGSTSLRWKGVYSGVGNFSGNLTVSGTAAIGKDTTIGNGTASTSMTTGALKVAGGIGATGQVNAKTIRVDNSVYFQYNSTDKCLDVIFG